MQRSMKIAVGMMAGHLALAGAMAGEANTSATATGGRGRSGSASATANYNGNSNGIGFARTNSDTGAVNHSRGLAFGVDRDGMDLSFSHAVAPKSGPAYAGTFNLSIGTDGSVQAGYGAVVATGGTSRTVEAGGTTQTNRHGATGQVIARGDTRNGGVVQARTESHNQPPRPIQVNRTRYVARPGR